MEKEDLILVYLTIDGMRCSMCEAHVNDALRKVVGVKKAKASAPKKIAKVLARKDVSLDELKASVAKDGYRVLDVRSEPYTKKGFFSKLFFLA